MEPGEYAQIVDLYGRNAADELFIQLGKRIEKAGEEESELYRAFFKRVARYEGSKVK